VIKERGSQLAHIAILVAIAVVLHAVEALLLLPLPVPGTKLGLANVATLLALILIGRRASVKVAVLRVFLGSLVVGTLFSFGFWLALSGAITSSVLMALCYSLTERGKASVSAVGISIIGGVAHNMAQLAVASIVLGKDVALAYAPYLLLAGLISGVLTGTIANAVIVRTASVLQRTTERTTERRVHRDVRAFRHVGTPANTGYRADNIRTQEAAGNG